MRNVSQVFLSLVFFILFSLSVLSYGFFPSPALAAETEQGAFWNDATFTMRAIYYGRDRDNHRAGGSASGEIDVDAFGYGLDFRSGYAWGVMGFDASLAMNLGSGDGNSEVLAYDTRTNRDESSASFREAALKWKFDLNGGQAGRAGEVLLRGGYTPIRVGTIGTSGGINPHGYRGFEVKWRRGNFEVGYGWADQFHNDWDRSFRDMTNMWHQNRDGYADGRKIDYIHSLGLRYAFGPNDAAFVDLGYGEGRDFRRNAQIAASYPIALQGGGEVTLTGYFIWGKYLTDLGYNFTTDPSDEHHFSASARYRKGPWTFSAGYGQTRAPDSREMQFRLTPWANSDNRNFIQTWAQLDDFVWDGQKVIKLSANLDLSEFVLPGLRFGVSYNYGWDINSYDARGTISAREIDLSLEYAPAGGPLQGWSAGIYPAWLRFEDDSFYGKPSRDDVKFIVSWSKTFGVRDF